MIAASIPRLSLAHLPTPIEPLPRLSFLLGGPRLFIKRDDQTGLALGGHKTGGQPALFAEPCRSELS
jgi:D-cysteine desulfhydrase